MNLITRITLIFIIASLAIFIGGGVITYDVMEREIDFEQRRFLVERLIEVEKYIGRRQPGDTVIRSKLIITPIPKIIEPTEPVFSDTLVTHTTLDRIEPHLKLEVNKKVGDRNYNIVLYDVIVESDDIVDGVTESLVTIYLILNATVILIAVIASYFVLKPFRNTLDFIKTFSLKNARLGEIEVPRSGLPEQQKLNAFLEEMIQKIVRDYQSLKEFSENASHELKTPLSIIQGKMDLMMHEEGLSEKQLEHLSSIQTTVKRLTRLSDALVLLTKIDNNEFSRQEKVNLSAILNQIMEEFKELIELKSIDLKVDAEENVEVYSDATLIEVMVSNLLTNAIRYNWKGGNISIRLSKDELVIENTGEELRVDTEELFKRFKKSNQSANSLGLGLAIVKRICDFSDFSINYLQIAKQHTITIRL